jgi:hypothetical protein
MYTVYNKRGYVVLITRDKALAIQTSNRIG